MSWTKRKREEQAQKRSDSLIGVVEQTYYHWRKQYGAMDVNQLKKLKRLKLLLHSIGIVFCFLVAPAQAIELEGEMQCLVKSNGIVGIEEGQVVNYTGFKSGMEVGDNLTFGYSYENDRLPIFAMYLDATSKNRSYFSALIRVQLSPSDVEILNDSFRNPDLDAIGSHMGKLAFSPDDILAIGFFDEFLKLHRYYKNDWEGVYVSITNQLVQTATLDCRHQKDVLDEVIVHFQSAYKLSLRNRVKRFPLGGL